MKLNDLILSIKKEIVNDFPDAMLNIPAGIHAKKIGTPFFCGAHFSRIGAYFIQHSDSRHKLKIKKEVFAVLNPELLAMQNESGQQQNDYFRQMQEWHRQMVQYFEQQRDYHLEQIKQFESMMNQTPPLSEDAMQTTGSKGRRRKRR